MSLSEAFFPKSVRETYERLGSGYSAISKLINSAGVFGLRNRLVSQAEGRVLEVGVGTGANFRHYPPHVSLVGVDISPEMLASAKKAAGNFVHDFSPVEADAMQLPFPDASFDTVVSTLTGCTYNDPVRAYSEMKRVCRPGGKILLLEHTYPKTAERRLLFTALRPIARICIGCNPLCDTESFIHQAEFVVITRESAVDGIFLSLVAKAPMTEQATN